MSAGVAVAVEASLDNLRSDDVRFLEEAAALGPLHARIPSDGLLAAQTGAAPLFPAAERLFLAESMRFVTTAEIVDRPVVDALDALATAGASLAIREEDVDPGLRAAAAAAGVSVAVVTRASRAGFPVPDPAPPPPGTPRIVVTGCYDWLHSGHIRFFLDAAAYGALYAVVGSDRNVELLKGPGHPLQREEERRYMVGAVRGVHQCLVSSGSGWMDAEPEVDLIKPAYYVVNGDGDQAEKRAFCAERGIGYVVLERKPHAGLPARSSTALRGF
ncbi:MAG TPA: adenylyltransferase/cytidyltransferase family protein [Candidatus Limnocylindrales bacterium]|nr:adenylyltransferase/cytidyltransferase family protein [Candidatus Limnocylindrales bacterium]